MNDIEGSIKPALELIKGYAYGNKITRQDIKDVLYLARNFNGRMMFNLLAEKNLIELIEGNPRFPDDNDLFRISDEGFKIID